MNSECPRPCLDIEIFEDLLEYLRATARIPPGTTASFTCLAGGVSNRAVLVEPAGTQPFVVKQALERLRVQTDWRSDPRRIEREALGLVWLGKLLPEGATPRLLFVDPQQHLLAMEAVPSPHFNWKTELLAGRLDQGHVEQFARILGRIHRRSREQVDVLQTAFGERTFFESLRLEPYYRYSAGQVPEARVFLEELIHDTTVQRLALVHGDYSPKNVLIHHGRLVLLDHEVIHFGDPAFDVGFSLTHFLSKAHHLPDCRRAFLQASTCYWRIYADTVGELGQSEGFENRAVRHTLGCLLARVEGRSPLEYFRPEERRQQRELVLSLLGERLNRIENLVSVFGAGLR